MQIATHPRFSLRRQGTQSQTPAQEKHENARNKGWIGKFSPKSTRLGIYFSLLNDSYFGRLDANDWEIQKNPRVTEINGIEVIIH